MSFLEYMGSVFSLRKLTDRHISMFALWDRESKISKRSHILRFARLLKVQLGRYSRIGVNCKVSDASIGNFTAIGMDTAIGIGSHPTCTLTPHSMFYRKNAWGWHEDWIGETGWSKERHITIGNDVWIGRRCMILDGVSIGDGAIVAAGAVVAKDVPPYAIVGGVPSKVIKYRFSPEIIEYLERVKWWNLPDEEITRCVDIFHVKNPTLEELKKAFDKTIRWIC